MAQQEFDQVSVGEVYRRMLENDSRTQSILSDIRNNMVSKAEHNALLNAQNARIASIEQNLAQKQADASHEHAELEAHSAARNQEVKNLLEKEQADRKLAYDKEQAERKASIKEVADRLQGIEDGNKKRRGEWLIAISTGGIAILFALFRDVFARGLGF